MMRQINVLKEISKVFMFLEEELAKIGYEPRKGCEIFVPLYLREILFKENLGEFFRNLSLGIRGYCIFELEDLNDLYVRGQILTGKSLVKYDFRNDITIRLLPENLEFNPHIPPGAKINIFAESLDPKNSRIVFRESNYSVSPSADEGVEKWSHSVDFKYYGIKFGEPELLKSLI